MTSCIPCSSHIAPEDLDRWTDNIQNVLMADEGRGRFKQFLESRQLDEALNTLEFWERTNACVQTYERQCKNHHLTSHQKSEAREHFKREARALVDYADENVNFNYHQMSLLYAALDKDTEDLHNTLARTLTSTSHLLDNEYAIFRKYLLKQKLSLHKKHSGKLSPTSAAALERAQAHQSSQQQHHLNQHQHQLSHQQHPSQQYHLNQHQHQVSHQQHPINQHHHEVSQRSVAHHPHHHHESGMTKEKDKKKK